MPWPLVLSRKRRDEILRNEEQLLLPSFLMSSFSLLLFLLGRHVSSFLLPVIVVSLGKRHKGGHSESRGSSSCPHSYIAFLMPNLDYFDALSLLYLVIVSCPGENKRGVRFRKEEQLLKAEEEAKRRMEGADARRKEHRRGIVRKANDANSKVRHRRRFLPFAAVSGVHACNICMFTLQIAFSLVSFSVLSFSSSVLSVTCK